MSEITAAHPAGDEGCPVGAEVFADLGWHVLHMGGASEAGLPPLGVAFALAHPGLGVALVDLGDPSSADPIGRLRRRLEASGFAEACPGYLPIIHRTLELRDLWRLSLVLDAPFRDEPPLLQDGPDWIDRVQQALLLDGARAPWAAPAPPEPAPPPRAAEPEPLAEPQPVAEPQPAAEPQPVAEPAPAPPPMPVAAEVPAAIPEPVSEAALPPRAEEPAAAEPPIAAAPRRLHPAWMLLAAAVLAAVGLSHHLVIPDGWARIGAWRAGAEAVLPLATSPEASPGPPAILQASAPAEPAPAEPTSGAAELAASQAPSAPVARFTLPPMEIATPATEPGEAPVPSSPGPELAAAAAPLATPAAIPDPEESRPAPVATVAAPVAAPFAALATTPIVPPMAVTPLAVTPEPAVSGAPTPAAEPSPAFLPPSPEDAPVIEAEAAPAPGPGAAVAASAPAVPATLPPGVIALLVARGDEMLARGDISGARLLYARAAAAGSSAASLAMGRSFDPDVLSRLGVRGIRADPEQAQRWYRLAKEAP